MLENLIIAGFTLLGIVTQRVIGFGAALFLTPVLLIYFSPPVSITVTLFVGGISSIVLLYMDRFKLELSWPIVIKIVLTAIPGVLLGSYIVTHINKGILQIIVGLLIVTSVLVQEYLLPKPTKKLSGTKGLASVGFLAGILNAAVAMAPMPILLWMRGHKTTPNQIRHNLAVIFILMNPISMTTIYFLKPHSLSSKGIIICAFLLPVIIIGNILGKRIAARINIKLFHKVIFVAIILAGIMSIVLGIPNLK